MFEGFTSILVGFQQQENTQPKPHERERLAIVA